MLASTRRVPKEHACKGEAFDALGRFERMRDATGIGRYLDALTAATPRTVRSAMRECAR